MKQIFKTIVLMVAITTGTIHANAQKTGVLKKDNYFEFSASQWEDFLDGKNSGEFEKKSEIPLATHLVNVKTLTAGVLMEPSIQAAKANSIIIEVPAGSNVYTAQADGSWINRVSYTEPGTGPNRKIERAFYHVPTKTIWLSLACGNLVNVTVKPVTPTTPTPQIITTTTPSAITATPGTTSLVNNLNNINPQSGTQELSWNTGYGVYKLGQNDFQVAMMAAQNNFMTAAAFTKMVQDSKECCGNTTNTAAATPAGYTYTGAAMQQPMIIMAGTQQTQLKWHETAVGKFGINLAANVAGNWISDELGIGGCDHNNGRCNGSCGGSGFNGGGFIYNGGPFHASSPAGIAPASSLIPGGGGNVYAGGGFNWRRN